MHLAQATGGFNSFAALSKKVKGKSEWPSYVFINNNNKKKNKIKKNKKEKATKMARESADSISVDVAFGCTSFRLPKHKSGASSLIVQTAAFFFASPQRLC